MVLFIRYLHCSMCSNGKRTRQDCFYIVSRTSGDGYIVRTFCKALRLVCSISSIGSTRAGTIYTNIEEMRTNFHLPRSLRIDLLSFAIDDSQSVGSLLGGQRT